MKPQKSFITKPTIENISRINRCSIFRVLFTFSFHTLETLKLKFHLMLCLLSQTMEIQVCNKLHSLTLCGNYKPHSLQYGRNRVAFHYSVEKEIFSKLISRKCSFLWFSVAALCALMLCSLA